MEIAIDWMDKMEELGRAFDVAVDAYNAAIEEQAIALRMVNPAGDIAREETRLKLAALFANVGVLNYRYQIAMAIINPCCSGNYLIGTLNSIVRNLERCVSEDHKAKFEYNTLFGSQGDAK